MRRPRHPRRESNLAKRLMARQMGTRAIAFTTNAHADKFRNMRCQGELDTEPGLSKVKLPGSRNPSRVVEIVAVQEFIFALTKTGVCAVFNRETRKRICYLNITSDEMIRSLFFNKCNSSIITVSVYSKENFTSLRCRSTPLQYLRRGSPESGFSLFEDESLRWPGFVEFDDVNSKVMTFSVDEKKYKIWDLANYELLYEIDGANIQEIKISPGVMLVIHNRAVSGSYVPLTILDISNGKPITRLNHRIKKNRGIDFVEQLNEKLLIKQEDEDLQILDIRDHSVEVVPKNVFQTPSAFVFLYENRLFLTFRRQTIRAWNYRGEPIVTLEDHNLWFPDTNTNSIYISSNQDLILSYCRDATSETGSVHVSSILDGKLVTKIPIVQRQLPENINLMQPDITTLMSEVTALYYNEETNEIYTGHRDVKLTILSN